MAKQRPGLGIDARIAAAVIVGGFAFMGAWLAWTLWTGR